MAEEQRIVLYAAKLCPFAHRVEITLNESGIDYERCEIDFWNKPEWYVQKVNPGGKVPAISYGGPKVPHDQPSPESTKLAESLVLVEFINDLSESRGNPKTSLLPKDPLLRAKARFFIETISSQLIPAFFNVCLRGENPQSIVSAIETLQNLLPHPTQNSGYALGEEWSIADAAVIPLLARAEIALKNDLGAYDEGTGKKAWDQVMDDVKFERFRRYYELNKKRKSFVDSFDPEFILENFKSRYPALRAKRLENKA